MHATINAEVEDDFNQSGVSRSVKILAALCFPVNGSMKNHPERSRKVQ